jgi:hypothetical protein
MAVLRGIVIGKGRLPEAVGVAVRENMGLKPGTPTPEETQEIAQMPSREVEALPEVGNDLRESEAESDSKESKKRKPARKRRK